MKLIVGLGNIGKKYQLTRHNLGFMVVDALVDTDSWTQKNTHSALIQKVQIENVTILVAKPTTFMNSSGRAVQSLMKYYSILIEDLLVIHDDVDLPLGHMKFQKSRGAGGHNGIHDIHAALNTNDYCRLKLGVGKDASLDTSDHVLSTFSKTELDQLNKFLGIAVESVCYFVTRGAEDASQKYNQKLAE